MPNFIPEVTYKFETKPVLKENGQHIPGGFTTILAKYVGTNNSNYIFQLLEMIIDNDIILTYPDNTFVHLRKEALSKTFIVSEKERVGGRKLKKSDKIKKNIEL
jgi:hypothetical protein